MRKLIVVLGVVAAKILSRLTLRDTRFRMRIILEAELIRSLAFFKCIPRPETSPELIRSDPELAGPEETLLAGIERLKCDSPFC